jgi:hypothetical protein
MNNEFDETQINKILNDYKNRRMRDRIRYETIKDNTEFKIKNRERAKLHYEQNKDKRKEKYIENNDLMRARNSYYYYKKNDKLDDLKIKYPDRWQLLLDNGYIHKD